MQEVQQQMSNLVCTEGASGIEIKVKSMMHRCTRSTKNECRDHGAHWWHLRTRGKVQMCRQVTSVQEEMRISSHDTQGTK